MSNDLLLMLIWLIPLAGSALSFFGGFYNKRVAGLIASAASAISFFLTYLAFSRLQTTGSGFSYSPAPWFELGNLAVHWGFAFDQLTAVMCLLITGVGSLIHIYSIGYMASDEGIARFFAYLNLFLASMLVLVLASNLPVLFIGWEGVGLCSYLLIGFWFRNADYAKAAQKAFVMNRIGDLGLLLAMFVIFYHFNSLEFSVIVNTVKSGNFGVEILTLMGGLLLLGAFGKSAQIPLFTWLPDAMAGPTPVSALIHAATMVTAGIYLVARMFPLFSAAPDLQLLLAIVSVITAFTTATVALTQSDIKKVLAYSTVSQLGFMFAALASGAFWLAIFHVLMHGFFKACLFLGAGSVIHGCHHEQDMRKMGGLSRFMPITFVSFLLATLAIAGIAPFAGYYSKHAILDAFAEHMHTHFAGSSLRYLSQLLAFTSFLTAFYMGRCLTLTFLGSYRGHSEHKPHEVPPVMWMPVAMLALLSVSAALLWMQPFAEFLSAVLPAVPHFHQQSFSEALMQSWAGIVGLGLAIVAYLYLPQMVTKIAEMFAAAVRVLKHSYFLDDLYEALIVRPLQWFSWLLWKLGDEIVLGASEGLCVFSTRVGGGLAAALQSGQVRAYGMYLLVALFALVFVLLGPVP